MAPSPIPAPLPPWARTLLQVAPFIQAGLQFALEYIGEAHDTSSPTPTQWRRVQLGFERIGNITSRDRCATTLDFVKMTSGGADSNWTPADESTLRGQVLTLGTAWMAWVNSNHHWIDAREYVMQFNPIPLEGSDPAGDKPIAPSGPPIWSNVYNMAGAAPPPGHAQAPQVAVTHTDRTAYPRHWGRSYWPYPVADIIGTDDQFTPGFVDQWGASIHSVYTTLMAAQIFPATVVTQIQKAPARGLLTTTSVQVDSVPDVVRRRRPSQTAHRYNVGL